MGSRNSYHNFIPRFHTLNKFTHDGARLTPTCFTVVSPEPIMLTASGSLAVDEAGFNKRASPEQF
jgi:hypothetical protein